MDKAQDLSDRQFEAVLARLDRIADEVARLRGRMERSDELERMTRELAQLNESLSALAYAALGTRGPEVRRHRAG